MDDYLAALPPDQRVALEALRAVIRNAAPAATEGIAYGMPAYKHHGKPLVYFGAAKSHLALYGNNARFVAHDPRLADFSVSKGTIRFTAERPLPADMVQAIIAARQAEIDGA